MAEKTKPCTFAKFAVIFTCGYAGIVIVSFQVLLTKWSIVAKTTIQVTENGPTWGKKARDFKFKVKIDL